VGVVKSDAFRMRMAEPAVEPAAASGKKAGTGPDPRPSIQERRR
jgi:hypothetical protein